MVEKGVELAKKNEMDEAKKCFEQAQEANPSIVIPAEIMYSLSFVSIKTALIPNTVSDKIFPKVTLAIKNKGKEDVTSLKLQAVFMDSGNIIGRTEKTIIQRDKPLAPSKTTKSISLTSAAGATGLKKSHMIQAKIYISYGKNADWKFARTITLSKRNDMFSVKKPKPQPKVNKPASNPVIDKNYKPSAFNTDPVSKPMEPVQNKPPVNNMPVPQPIPVPVLVQPGNSNSTQSLPPINNQDEGFRIE